MISERLFRPAKRAFRFFRLMFKERENGWIKLGYDAQLAKLIQLSSASTLKNRDESFLLPPRNADKYLIEKVLMVWFVEYLEN